MPKPKYDFSGYATKVNIVCSDGRTIMPDAFKHMDGKKVTLVWQHGVSNPMNVLGNALLEHRADGVYAYGTFNDTPSGKHAKTSVEHGDLDSLSINANQLKEVNGKVLHGMIREVSLVVAGANPGARIDNISIQHGDDIYQDETEAIIYSGETITHSTEVDSEVTHEDAPSEKTVKEVFDTLNDQQKDVVFAMLAAAVAHDDGGGEEMQQSDEGGNVMKHNVFDQAHNEEVMKGVGLMHANFDTILETAKKCGHFKEAVIQHAGEYGIQDISVLFPDAQALSKDPEWLERETGWVSGVLGAVHKSPFSRVKSVFADMNIEEARAKGYTTGAEKDEIFLKCAKRVTTPTTVYVKQKLDRDDIIDITDFNAVGMVQRQMRTVLDEELAVAMLIGDGRSLAHKDKIKEDHIRPIWTDEELFTVTELLTTKVDYKKMIKEIAFTNKRYKGSGAPVLYTTSEVHTGMLWVEDGNGRRIYESDATLCAALRVSKIEEIPHFEGKTRVVESKTRDLLAIKVNLKDYNFGTDKGGQITSFEDFDIDFNQHKYLLETRLSGALTKAFAAQVYEFERP